MYDSLILILGEGAVSDNSRGSLSQQVGALETSVLLATSFDTNVSFQKD
jgi:hypothetical protein